MSEYQYVVFRAIDGPVSEKNLAFMQRQSSHAEVAPWSFSSEYHHGDFHGKAAEMLNRGYDFHLHYANFGTRKLMIRLPNGLPDPKAAKPYFSDEAISFKKHGQGGILCFDPGFEAGQLDEVWNVDEVVDRLLPLRREIMDGDLRPLYLAYLGVAGDMNHDPEEEKEPPVPAGLAKLTKAQRALAEFYGLDDGLIAVAARNSPALPKRAQSEGQHLRWLELQPEAAKNAWLAELMADPDSAVPRKILAEFQRSQAPGSWPTVRVDRTIAELMAAGRT
jgi:hypothetical protein